MYSLVDKLLGFSEEFRSKNTYRCRSIANFVVLDLTNIHEHLCSCIIQGDGFEDCCAVIGDGDASRRRRLQDFILQSDTDQAQTKGRQYHPLGAERAFDEIADCDCPDEGGLR